MDTHNSDIRRFIDQGQQAHDAAVSLLVQRYTREVYCHFFDLLRDGSQAQAMTDQTFLKVRYALIDYDNKYTPYLWLMRIATELYEAQNPQSRLEEWIDDNEWEDLMSELEPQDRLVLRPRRLGHHWRDVAYILGIKEATARKRGERAMKRLRRIRDERGETT